jgi:hypothetical protein
MTVMADDVIARVLTPEALRRLGDLRRSCRHHGTSFAAAGFGQTGEPNCPTCKEPYQVAQLMALGAMATRPGET